MSNEFVMLSENMVGADEDTAGYRWYFDDSVSAVKGKPMFGIDNPVKWIWESGGSGLPFDQAKPATSAVMTSEFRNSQPVSQIKLNTKYQPSEEPEGKKQSLRTLWDQNRMAPKGPDMGWHDPRYPNMFADSAIRGTFHFYVDGYEVAVPDVWWLLGHTFPGDTTFSWLFSNWCDYAPLRAEVDGTQKVTMYGYRAKDNAPMVVTFSLMKRDGSGLGNIHVTAHPLLTDSVEAFMDEFNWRLAKRRFEQNWDLDVSSFLKSDGMNDNKRVYVPFTAVSMNLNTVQVSDLGQDVQIHKDYAQQFTLRNQTDAPMVMKSSDYTIAIASTDTWSVSFTAKEAFSWSTKTTVKTSTKIKLPLPIEGGDAGERTTEESTEKTFTKSFEFSETIGYTHTKTTTETFAFSGQTFTVPPHTDLQLNYDVYRGDMRGKIRLLMDLPKDPEFTAIEVAQGAAGQGWQITKRAVSLDMIKAKEVLGLTKVWDEYVRDDKSTAKGTLIAAVLDMTVDMGVIGHISVAPVNNAKKLSVSEEDALRPVATLESLSISMPLAVPLKEVIPAPKPDPKPEPNPVKIMSVKVQGQNAILTTNVLKDGPEVSAVVVDGHAPTTTTFINQQPDGSYQVVVSGLSYMTHKIALKTEDGRVTDPVDAVIKRMY